MEMFFIDIFAQEYLQKRIGFANSFASKLTNSYYRFDTIGIDDNEIADQLAKQ